MTKMLTPLAAGTLCRDLAMLLAAGASADEALDLIREDLEPGEFLTAVTTLRTAMEDGSSFGEAARATGVLPAYAAQMVLVGERSGRLEEVLERLADYYERQEALDTRLKNALTYPVTLMAMMCAVLAVMVCAVLPVFVNVYQNLAGDLLSSSFAYVSASHIVGWASLILAAVVFVALLLCLNASRTPKGRAALAARLENFGPTRQLTRQLALSRFVDGLSTFLASGMDPDDALAQTAPTITHKGLAADVAACRADMKAGASLSRAFFDHRIFVPLYGRMLLSAARTGTTEGVLARLGRLVGQDAEDRIYALIDMVEPIMAGFLTLSIGVTLLAVMLPLVGILGSIG